MNIRTRAGTQAPRPRKRVHSLTEWLAYIEDYVREAQHILARTARQDAYPQVTPIMRKIAAMATSAMEEHGAPRRVGVINEPEGQQ